MYKKSQITYFILFGFIILIAVGLIFYIYNQNLNENLGEISFDKQPFELFIRSCIEQTGVEALVFVSQQGGYYNLPNPHYSSFLLSVPYYFYNNFPLNPTKEQVENQISNYMNENLFFCFRNFVNFKEQGYEVDVNKITTKTTIIPNKLLFGINIPMKIKKQNTITSLDNFRVELDNIGLYKIIEFNNLVLKLQAKDPYSICLSCILNLTINYNLYLRMSRIDNNTLLLNVIDNKTAINQKPLEFNFANKYKIFSCENLPPDDVEFVQQCVREKIENLTPKLEIKEIPNFAIKVGEPFLYRAEAIGKNYVFEDFSDLFDINQTTGVISFVPTSNQSGNHTAWIGIKDKIGQEIFTSFKITIEK